MKRSRVGNISKILKGGARTQEQRDAGAKCAGETDPVSLNEIPPEFAIRVLENGRHFCYDIRSLFEWFELGKRTNPLTNLQFSEDNINKIKRKFIKAGLVGPQVPATLNRRELEFFSARNLGHWFGAVYMYNPGLNSNGEINVIWHSRNYLIRDGLQTGFPEWFYEIVPSLKNGRIDIFSKDLKSYNAVKELMIPILGAFNHFDDSTRGWEF